MLKREIKYTDFNDDPQTDVFYFNLSKPEIVKFLAQFPDGLEKYIQKVVANNDTATMIAFLDDFITRSYGIKSDDGKQFIKDPEYTRQFMQTNAYSELYIDLMGDADKFLAFIMGIVPKDLSDAFTAEELKKKTAEAIGATENKED